MSIAIRLVIVLGLLATELSCGVRPWLANESLPSRRRWSVAETDFRSAIEALIDRARSNPGFLGQLLECYRPLLRVKALKRFGRRQRGQWDASGIVQATFAEALRDFARFGGSSEPEFWAWLKRIQQRNIQDVFRRSFRERAPRRTPEPPANDPTASQHAAMGERRRRLDELLAALPEMQREAVRLRHLEGRSVAAVAERLGRSPAATAGLIKRGLQALRAKMSEDSWC